MIIHPNIARPDSPVLVASQSERRKSRLNAEHDRSVPKKPTEKDIRERIERAKAYKLEKKAKSRPVRSPAKTPFGEEVERPADSERRLSAEEFRARFNRGVVEDSEAPGFRQGVEIDPVQDPEFFSGNAERRASFLPADLEKNPPAEGRKEDGMGYRAAEVISVDKSYRPKVATWGIFPRPANISEAYGGGRVIDPSEPLESKEMAEKRETEIAEALKEYKRIRGLLVEPEVEEMYNKIFKKGEELAAKGELSRAAQKFEDASKVVDFKTKLCGEAMFQQAVCLDSIGMTKPAKAIYDQLVRHPQSEVRSKAKRMLFGFQAMDHLKVTKMKKSDFVAEYSDYFNTIPQSYSSTYIETEDKYLEAFDDNLKLAIWMSGAILFLPLVLILVLTSN